MNTDRPVSMVAKLRKALKEGDLTSIETCMAHERLLTACAQRDIETIKVLIGQGVDIHASGFEGFTPFTKTIESEWYTPAQEQVCNLLMEHGADINARDGFLRTPLAVSVLKENKEICKFLIKNKADVNLPSEKEGRPPFVSAPWHSDYNLAIPKLLIEAGADVNARDYSGNTSLDHVIHHKKLRFAMLLMQHGAKVTPSNSSQLFSIISDFHRRECLSISPDEVASFKKLFVHLYRTEATAWVKDARNWGENDTLGRVKSQIVSGDDAKSILETYQKFPSDLPSHRQSQRPWHRKRMERIRDITKSVLPNGR